MTITAGDLDSSAFNIQGIGFATGLAGPLVGCRDSLADNFNIDTGGVYGPVNAVVVFNTHSDPGDPNECLYTGCMDQNSPSFFSTVYNGNTYYATLHQYNNFTAGSCDYEGCYDSLALNYNVTCTGYNLTPLGLSITIANNACCVYPQSWDCDTVIGGCTTIAGAAGQYVVCHDYYNPLAPPNVPAGCYSTPQLAQNAACISGNCPSCGSSSVQGCTDPCSPNYDPLATCDDGSCIVPTGGCMDDGSMTIGQVNISGNSIWPSTVCNSNSVCTAYDSYDSSWSYVDLSGTELNASLGDDIIANNYDPLATYMDCSCEYHGCTDSQAINYESFHTHEDGSCIYDGCTDPNSINGVTTYNHPNPGTFYINPIDATVDDGSCVVFGCNDIETPNVAPWNGNPISETIINDNAFEETIESWNEFPAVGNPSLWGHAAGNNMEGLVYGHAGNFDDSINPLSYPGSHILGSDCGIPSTFSNNILNVADYGNGILGDCSVSERLSHLQWHGLNGSFTYDGLSCTQGFANAWGPFDTRYWQGASATGHHNDGFYLQKDGFPKLTEEQIRTFYNPVGQNITDLSGIQDFALNPAFKRLVIHNQYITNFIHTESDPASPYYALDMLDTLFQHAPNFDCLSLKSCTLGGVGQVLDLTNWSNCSMIEIVDISYDEININHINNPNCYSICIVNDTYPGNNFGNHSTSANNTNKFASGTYISLSGFQKKGYSAILNIDWSLHTPGDIASPKKPNGPNFRDGDQDESWKQAWVGGGLGYNKDSNSSTVAIPLNLVGEAYANPDQSIGEHFPPQPIGFTGWDASTGFSGDPASHFVPQHKLAPITPALQMRPSLVDITTRRDTFRAWEEQLSVIGVVEGAWGNAIGTGLSGSNNNYQWHYQGDITGDQRLGQNSGAGGMGANGFAWSHRPSGFLLSGTPQGTPVGAYYGSGNSGCSQLPVGDPNNCINNPEEDPDLYDPVDPSRKIDNQMTAGVTTDQAHLNYVLQSRLVLINLKNLRHVWLGPDWEPIYAMNRANNKPTLPNFNFSPKNPHNRGLSIKGCGNGNTVYVHTSGRAMEFKKRYGTNDQTAVNQYGETIYSTEGETFFLEYFDSNVVFVD